MRPHYDFFLSYSTIDYNQGKKDDIRRFVADLEAELRRSGRTDGGFFAARTIETGFDWKDELVAHLKCCHVMVPFYSANYFRSPHCGREWKVFYDRFQENRTNKRPRDVQQPEVILPVLWTADLFDVPKEVEEVQYETIAVYPSLYCERGLSYLMRSSRRAQYDEFVYVFGKRLADMLRTQGAPKERPILAYHEIDPVFPADSKRGLTVVRYVFVVGTQDEMRELRRGWNGYGIYLNRTDWQPCHPVIDLEAGEIASRLAEAAGKAFEFIEPGDHLFDRLNYAKELENIVVIVVDPWSMAVPSLKNLAYRIDSEVLPNSALFFVCSESVGDAIPVLNVPGGTPFERRSGRNEYVVTVRSHDELQRMLESFFNTAREAMGPSGKIPSAEQSGSAPPPVLKS